MIEAASSKGATGMSRLSFKTFCIELYAEAKNRSSTEIYDLFEREKVLQMLDEDYDVLHGFDFNFLIGEIDRFLGIAC